MYGPTLLALGLVSQIGQILSLRELLMLFHGNELSLGIIFAAWIFWGGVGSILFSGQAKGAENPELLLAVSSAVTAVVLPLTLIGIRIMWALFPLQRGSYLSIGEMLISSFTSLAPLSILFGFQFVLISRIRRMARDCHPMGGAERTYAAEAAGTGIAGILFSLLFVRFLDPFQTAALGSAVMPAALLLLNRKKRGSSGAARYISLGLLTAIAFSFPLLPSLNEKAYALQWRFFAPQYQRIETRRSKHGTLIAAKREGQYSFFQSGHLLFSTALPEHSESSLEEIEGMLFAHYSMLQHPAPEKVLLVGGGIRGTLREMAKYPVQRIDYVELDPELTALGISLLPEYRELIEADPVINLLHTDGRLFIKYGLDHYDLILIDLPDPATAVLNRFYTLEFFQEIAARLAPGGVFVIGAVSTPDMRSRGIANRNASIYHTMAKVFPQVLPAGERYLFFAASTEKGVVSSDPRVLQSRYLEKGIASPDFSLRQLDLLLEETRLRRINWIIRNHGRNPGSHMRAPETGPLFPESIAIQQAKEAELNPVRERYFINSDFRPVGYFHTLQFWHELTRGSEGPGLLRLMEASYGQLFALPAFLIIPALALKLSGRKNPKSAKALSRFVILTAIASTGISTMGVQIALIFSFQSLYGFVFEMIGLITALFMAGLAGGAEIMRRFLDRRQKENRADATLLAVVQGIMAFSLAAIGLILPVLSATDRPSLLFIFFSLSTIFAGFLNGLDFPLTSAFTYAASSCPEKAAGSVYGLELLGASIGAVVASTAIIPVFGISSACFFSGFCNAVACILLIISGRRHE